MSTAGGAASLSLSPLRLLRTLLRPLAIHAAYSPIETIVFFCVVGILSYFHILNTIKHSSFFLPPSHPYSPAVVSGHAGANLRPAYVLAAAANGETGSEWSWTPTREGVWKASKAGEAEYLPVEFVQVAFRPDAVSEDSDDRLDALDEVRNVTLELVNRYKEKNACFLVPGTGECFEHFDEAAWTHTIGFIPSALANAKEDVSKRLAKLAPSTASRWKFTVQDDQKAAEVSIGEMKSSKWVAYAARALVLRFWDLAKKAPTPDILLILTGYILMHLTFLLLFRRSRALGSSVSLPIAILSSSFLALIVSIPIAWQIGIRMNLVELSEAVPFLVCTVGFDKPMRLAKAVFGHENLLSPVQPQHSSTQSSGRRLGSLPPGTLPPPGEIILSSLQTSYSPIIRDYFLEIGVLLLGAWARVSGLSDVCKLGALVLGIDCLLMCTFLSAILGVMVSVRRIRARTEVLRAEREERRKRGEPVSSASSVASSPRSSYKQLKPDPEVRPKELGKSSLLSPGIALRKIKDIVLGTKTSPKGRTTEKEQNPVARLKLLLIATFLSLHILNLVTPLTIPQKSSRHSHPGDELFRPVPRRVDTSKPAIQAVLSAFNSQVNATDSSKSVLAKVNSDIVVSVADLAFPSSSFEMDPTQKQIMNKLSLLTKRITSSPTTMKKALSDFLDGWTLLVSDPLMSKWVVIALGVSMVLNGLLLRGLVEREAGPGPESDSYAPVPSPSSTLAVPRAEEKQSSLARNQKSSDRIRWEPGTEMRGNGSMSVSRKGSLLGLRSAAAAASGSGRVSPSTIGFSSAVQPGPSGYNFALSEASGSSSGRGSLRLEDVDRKLERVGGTIHEGVPHTLSQTPGTPSSRRKKFIVGGKGSSESSDEADAASAPAPAPASAVPAPTIAVTVEKPKPHRSLTAPPEQLTEQQNGPAGPGRELKALVELYTSTAPGAAQRSLLTGLTDEEILALSRAGKIPAYGLEKALGGENVVGDGWDGPVGREYVRAVRIRRGLIEPTRPVDKSEKAREEFDLEFKTLPLGETEVPFESYDYTKVFGACCENVVGYVPIPLGIAGPLHIDGKMVPIPMATAEGTLVASTSRGSKALNASGGVKTVVLKDGMTRGPAIEFPSLDMAYQAYRFLDPTNVDGEEGYELVKAAFESTSRFAKLVEIKCALAGRTLFVRFCTRTGDAMGMNMISKATEKALATLQMRFPDMLVLALSGNYCADKKPTAINWIEGRGKSVVAEAVIKGDVVKSVLKTNVETLVKVNTKKNLVGSAMAGAMGGFNAHAANILTAIFLATGQDPAQNVESSQCMTLMESINGGQDLLMTITMPSIEVGTVGGGTILSAQGSVLNLLGIRGSHPTTPGANAQQLARIIAAAVMAGELSLISALAAGHLVRAHMQHNRSVASTPITSRPVTPGLVPQIGGAVTPHTVIGQTGMMTPLSATGNGSYFTQSRRESRPVTPGGASGELPPYEEKQSR